jgi:phage shock protein A
MLHRDCGPELFRAKLSFMGKSTSETLRQETEELRATAIRLMQEAAKLIAKSGEVEKKISQRRNDDPDRGRKTPKGS